MVQKKNKKKTLNEAKNTNKCCLIVSGTKHEHVWIKLGTDIIRESNSGELLGVKMDRELKFDEYISK